MVITSLKFLFFVVAVLFLLSICHIKYRWIVLLAASLVFYGMAGMQFLPFILFTSFTIWYGAKKIDDIWQKQKVYLQSTQDSLEIRKARKASDQKKAKRILLLLLFLNVGILCAGKLLNYLSVGRNISSLEKFVIIPLGISYYTFSTVGYLLDVYWKRYAHEANYFRFLLFTGYFPHLMQGPISRYPLLGQELKKNIIVSIDNIVSGAALILWGYFKKLVIADRLNIFVTNAFSINDNNGVVYLVAIFFDVIQIYADFSAYMDIMCGISQMYGVTLESNFDHPFFSRSVSEFWRRWHMTLGGWFKDYVYYPITVSKGMKKFSRWSKQYLPKKIAQIFMAGIPVMTVWILTGLWHGTGAGYVAWGLYYGTLITISIAFEEFFKKLNRFLHIRTDCFSFRLFQMCRTFCIFAGGRLLTKGGSFRGMLQIVRHIVYDTVNHWFVFFDESLLGYGLEANNMAYAIYGIILIWAVSMLQVRYNIREKLAEQNLLFRWSIYLIGIFTIIIFGVYGNVYSTEGFAYQQF